jgi:bifunctional DNA-binding transcriptional regulator/antitoxin component of YhaV-PrlF toxin-antitoxin module
MPPENCGLEPDVARYLVLLNSVPSTMSHVSIQEYLVSASGQMSLPAAARHRWHLDDGGPVDVIDLGFGVLTAPKGTARTLLADLVTREQHAEFVRSLDDDADLATT